MSNTLKLGFKASSEQFAPQELLNYGILAEEIGLDSVWISDHFQPWRHTGGHAPFSLSWLAALGAKTKRVVMGTSVLTPSFRYHPSIVAQAFGTMGCLFPNRLILGVGTGESLNEVPASGLHWPEQRERTLRLKESVRLIKTLWSEDRVDFEGEYYRTERATIYDKPDTPVPIYIAGAGPVMAKYAGTNGEGFICTSGKAWELYQDKLLPKVAEGLEQSQRTHTPFDRTIEIKLSYNANKQQALQDTRFWGALALKPEEKMNMEDPLAMEQLADELPAERAASRWIVTDDADEVVEKVKPYVDMGFNHLVFHYPGPNQAEFLNLFGETLNTRLRQAFG